jgi:glucose uptake protein
VFAVGILLCTIPANYLLMRRPISGSDPLTMRGYFAARGAWHLLAILGGTIWCTGTVLNFIAANAQVVGPAVSYAIGNGATMVSAVWGVVVWNEFSDAPAGVMRLVALMFVLFLAGLGAIAVAPLWRG